MPKIPGRSRISSRPLLFLCCLLAFAPAAALFLLSGCGARKRPNIPWATAVRVKPVVPPTAAATQSSDGAPDLHLEIPPYALLLPVHPGPPRPRMPSAPAAPGSEAEKSPTPIIVPQLSAQEATAARQETNQSLGIVEKNLAATRGKTLNATQSDMASKINGFLKDAREAVKSGDWSRARNLAKKAEVLSQELAGSL